MRAMAIMMKLLPSGFLRGGFNVLDVRSGLCDAGVNSMLYVREVCRSGGSGLHNIAAMSLMLLEDDLGVWIDHVLCFPEYLFLV
jgi:hypothetical protein